MKGFKDSKIQKFKDSKIQGVSDGRPHRSMKRFIARKVLLWKNNLITRHEVIFLCVCTLVKN
jgi:hypothetical protein